MEDCHIPRPAAEPKIFRPTASELIICPEEGKELGSQTAFLVPRSPFLYSQGINVSFRYAHKATLSE